MGSTIQWREPPEDRANNRTGGMVEFGRYKDAGRGYMAHSDRVGPSVIVLHEFFGLQPSFTTYADELNEAGFTVLAPDLYAGRIAADVDEAQSMARSLDVDSTLAMLQSAASLLTESWHPRLGIVGFSLGADFAAELAARTRPDALVLYYGVGEVADGRWTGPTLGHFASDDEWTPRADAEAAFAALDRAGVDAAMHVYPATGHWFANASVPDHYDQAAAALAFDRTTDFLHHHLA